MARGGSSDEEEDSAMSEPSEDASEEASLDDEEASESMSEDEGEPEKLPQKRAPGPSRPALPPRPPASGSRGAAGRAAPTKPSPALPSRPTAPAAPPRPSTNRLDDSEPDVAADDVLASDADLQRRREANIKALVSGQGLQCQRTTVMSKFLILQEADKVLRRPFTSPVQGAPAVSEALKRKLASRRTIVPWGSSTPVTRPAAWARPSSTPAPSPAPPEPEPKQPEIVLPPGVEPLVLWQAPADAAAPDTPAPGAAAATPAARPAAASPAGSERVEVDPMLTRWLRPHQREGVQFMFDCVCGLRLEEKHGCILADDMGLGKTLQGITLLWTLLTAPGHPLLGGAPIARRAIIVCPTSLVSNWDNECTKWLQGRLRTLAMCESSREDVVSNIGLFLHPANTYKVLIISYETFRLHAERFQVPHACDLLICDEAHRLKNDATLTNRALGNLPCKRRVLLSGTPMQNHLDEFFAMVDFCNPGVLGQPAQFRRHYEVPILASREPGATADQIALGEERSAELSGLTNRFILRRTNALLSAHLPPKVIEVVCCRLTELQRQLYCHFLQSKAARRVLNGRTSGVLSAITSLKKLCNHPKLIYDAIHSKAALAGEEGDKVEGFENVGSLFPPGLFDNGRAGRGGMAVGWEAVSGKMAVLARMLHLLYTETNDRIVLVSNYTSTLDLFAQICRERGYPFVRLDGTTTINKRQKLVKVFNDPAEKQFAFLLSSKAGGCGLNLIGANRLVLYDPDWNPANDAQAAARVWRDGQRKRVFVYRFLSTGSIEEKVFQRQLSKEGLKQLVSKSGKAAANVMTSEDLRELFALNADVASDTWDHMCAVPAGGRGAEGGAEEALEDPAAPCGRGGAEQGEADAAEGPIDLASDESGDEEGSGAGAKLRGAAATGQRRGSGEGGGGGPGGEGGAAAAVPRQPVPKDQVGEPPEEDLANWGHHPSPDSVPDAVMRRIGSPDVTFVFSCKVAGKHIEGGDEEEQRILDGAAAAAAGPGPGSTSAGLAGRGGRGMSTTGRPPRMAAAAVGAAALPPRPGSSGGAGPGPGGRAGGSSGGAAAPAGVAKAGTTAAGAAAGTGPSAAKPPPAAATPGPAPVAARAAISALPAASKPPTTSSACKPAPPAAPAANPLATSAPLQPTPAPAPPAPAARAVPTALPMARASGSGPRPPPPLPGSAAALALERQAAAAQAPGMPAAPPHAAAPAPAPAPAATATSGPSSALRPSTAPSTQQLLAGPGAGPLRPSVPGPTSSAGTASSGGGGGGGSSVTGARTAPAAASAPVAQPGASKPAAKPMPRTDAPAPQPLPQPPRPAPAPKPAPAAAQPSAAAGTKPAAVAAAAVAGAAAKARPRDEGPGGPAGQARQEAPLPKRPKAPGWYIDDSDDDLM
ncbi:hypothetical protein HYH03_004251 [Edaphochlamys debaryana]|uniref:Uncharacterized protein n=1 Tax=Edaphochlamys debaryana TaxID=47281 RepID=A0A835YAM9_9CHLO|nr:hypothetical protein HYH03_004251 [Edaphochlamys debaryana]|eukprot:KAG2497992.1 hypothetical protein HYH03_004251 [Edaphochlamys debaryana]